MQIPIDKREKILDAALAEFSQQGYGKASTNQITQKAGISKGLLFHYFGSKKKLFLATFEFCAQQFLNYFSVWMPQQDDLSTDFFERLLTVSEVKYRYYQQHSSIYHFLVVAVRDMFKYFPDEMNQQFSLLRTLGMTIFMEGIDFSRFRDDIDRDKAILLICKCLQAYTLQLLQHMPAKEIEDQTQWESVFEEIREIIYLFRDGLYRDQ